MKISNGVKCDIIIPVWNQLEVTRACIEHIKKNTHYPYGLILIDNGSDAQTESYLKGLKEKSNIEIILIRNEENLGFVKAVNQGLKTSNASYVCILNNDTEPGIGWLTELVGFAERHPEAGLLNPLCNGHAGRNLSVNEYAKLVSSNKDKYMEMNQCQGFCMLIKREVIDKIGYLDERFGIGGFDDTDYSMRAHIAGYKSVCVHSSYVYHREHASFDRMGERKKIQGHLEKEYFKKWPRHLRIAVIFSLSDKAGDEKIANLLNSALFLAREWCWVNIMFFGKRDARERAERVKEKIRFPLHQNIKFNYLASGIKILEISARILERSFGTKKRKRYDAVIYDEKENLPFLRFLCNIQKCSVLPMDFSKFSEDMLQSAVRRPDMKCDIILPVCDQYPFTKKCVESIIANTDTPYRLIIINNGKNPKTKRFLDGLAKNGEVETTIVHNERNIGWVKALNKGIDISWAPYVCFQNDDTVVTRGWLKKMINTLRLKEDFGMINPTWEGRPASVSIDAYNRILEKNTRHFVETDWCRGFCAVMKRSVIEKIGKVDEIYGLAYFDDVDYSVTAINAGFLCLRALDTYVYHKRNATFFQVLKGESWNELHEKNKLIYYKKWGRPLRISLVLDREAINDNAGLEGIADALYYLARKQHRVYVFCTDKRISERVAHTNIIFRFYPAAFLHKLAALDLFLNIKKKQNKRYDAVFVQNAPLGKRIYKKFADLRIFSSGSEKEDFDLFLKRTIDDLKERTREDIRV